MDTTVEIPPRTIGRETVANSLATAAVVVAIFFVPAFSCSCGYLSGTGLWFMIPTAILTWWAFLFGGPTHLLWRLFRIGAVALLTIIALKNAADVLWFGHQPLYHIPRFLR